jgi:hypothetical protein
LQESSAASVKEIAQFIPPGQLYYSKSFLIVMPFTSLIVSYSFLFVPKEFNTICTLAHGASRRDI